MEPTDPSGEDYYDKTFAARRTAITEKLMEVCADGEWHNREDVIRAVIHTIEPGPAYRFAERQRINGRKLRARKSMSPEDYAEWLKDESNWARNYHHPVEMDEIVRNGARGMIIERIHSSRRFEVKGAGATAEVRRVPIHPRYSESAAAIERRQAAAEGREPDPKVIYNARYNERKKAQRRERGLKKGGVAKGINPRAMPGK